MRLFSELTDVYQRFLDGEIKKLELETFIPCFVDLSAKNVEIFGERVLDDIFARIEAEQEEILLNLCQIFDSFVKSSNFPRFSTVAEKILTKLIEKLKILTVSGVVSSNVYAVLTTTAVYLFLSYDACDGQKSTEMGQKIRKLFRRTENFVGSAKILIMIARILFDGRCDENSLDLDERHSCVDEKCVENFCLRRFFLENLRKSRGVLFARLEDDEKIEKLVAFLVKIDEFSLGDFYFWDENNAVFKFVLKFFILSIADCVEGGFVFGRDRSVWLTKFADLTLSDDAGRVSAKIVNKFFRHVDKDPWKGRTTNEASNFLKKLRKLTNLPPIWVLNSFSFASKSILSSFAVVFLKIIEKFDIETEEKFYLSENWAKILRVLLDDEKFASEYLPAIGDSVVCKLVEILVDILFAENSSSVNEFERPSLGILEKLIKISPGFADAVIRSIFDKIRSTNSTPKFVYRTISKYLNSVSTPSDAWRSIDEFLAEKLSEKSVSLVDISPCATDLLDFKRKTGVSFEFKTEKRISKLVAKIRRILNDCDFETFCVCVNFLLRLENEEHSSKFVDWFAVPRADSTFEKLYEEKTIMTNLGRCFRFISASEISRLFDELGQNPVWRAFVAKILLNALETERKSYDQNFLDAVKREFTLLVDETPIWFALNWSKFGVEIQLQLFRDLISEKTLQISKKRLVSNVLTLISTIDFDRIDDFWPIFDLSVEILTNILRFCSDALVACIGNFSGVTSKLLYQIISRCSAIDDDDEIVDERLKSARKFSRLPSAICSSKLSADYKIISHYSVANFVDAVRRYPKIHKRIYDVLVAGIYDSLDLCDEHAAAMLATNLDDGCKDIFRSIHDDYRKYFKYKGYV